MAKIFFIKIIWRMRPWLYFFLIIHWLLQQLSKKFERNISIIFLKKYLDMTIKCNFSKIFKNQQSGQDDPKNFFCRKSFKTTWIAVINNRLHCSYLPWPFFGMPENWPKWAKILFWYFTFSNIFLGQGNVFNVILHLQKRSIRSWYNL